VTDSAGNQYVLLTRFTASDGTEMSVWTTPVTVGGGTRPTITVTASGPANLGAAALEYFGVSSAADATVVDQMAHATGTTSGAATVASGATPATTGANELALGLYADSGFGDALTGDAAYAQRVNVSPTTTDMELLAEDRTVGAGTAANSTVSSSAKTTWLMATIVLKGAPAGGAAPATATAPTAGPAATAAPAGPTPLLKRSTTRNSARKRPHTRPAHRARSTHSRAGGCSQIAARLWPGSCARFDRNAVKAAASVPAWTTSQLLLFCRLMLQATGAGQPGTARSLHSATINTFLSDLTPRL
jgi:hypothetical protein